jgi:hypothetical protein
MSALTKTKKKRQSREQKLFDAVSYAVSCLKEAGDPLHGLGPNQQYVDAFDRYGRALKDLVAHTCVLHVADWSWDGYEGDFGFHWEFGTQLAQPGTKYDHDTRFVAMRCAARFDPGKPLLEELARLRAEAEHYDELRRATVRWARDAREKDGRKAAPQSPARVTMVCADCDQEQCVCAPQSPSEEPTS